MLFLLITVTTVFSQQQYCEEGIWCPGVGCCEGGCITNPPACMGEWEDMIPQTGQITGTGNTNGQGTYLPYYAMAGDGADGAEEGNIPMFPGHNHDGNGCFAPYTWCPTLISCQLPGQICPPAACPPAPMCGCPPGMENTPTKDANNCITSCTCTPATATATNTAGASGETESEVEAPEAGETPETETENEAAEEAAEAAEEAAEVGGLLRQTQPTEPESSAPSALPQLALVSGIGFTAGVLLAFCWRKQTAEPKISFEDFYQDIALDVQ